MLALLPLLVRLRERAEGRGTPSGTDPRARVAICGTPGPTTSAVSSRPLLFRRRHNI